MSDKFDWTDAQCDRLRMLWMTGVPTNEIGRRMGLSKNAIIGKAHRLLLEPRLSPIIRTGKPTGPTPKRAPPLRMLWMTGVEIAPEPVVTRAPVRPAPTPPATPPALIYRGRIHPCYWPVRSEFVRGRERHILCDDDSLPGKSYCACHTALAHPGVRKRPPALVIDPVQARVFSP